MASRDEEKNRIIRGSIKEAQELRGMNVAKISLLTGIPQSTLYQRIQHPERFTVGELRAVFKVLRYKEEEKIHIAKEAI